MRPVMLPATLTGHYSVLGRSTNMVVMTVLALMMAAGGAGDPPGDSSESFPAIVESGHFYLVPETTSGQRLKLLVDTGGGYKIYPSTVQRLHLSTHRLDRNGSPMTVADWPVFKPGLGLPPHPDPALSRAVFVIDQAPDINGIDGVLGGPVLSGHAWTFDYPGHRLTMLGKHWSSDKRAHRTTLGFPLDDNGQVNSPYPRITIRVAGAPVDMLLDTGATAKPTSAGEKASATPTTAGYGVTSYITASIFNQWHKAHPDWRVVEDGDDLQPHARLIEVPRVDIAGWSVGPVWFTERSDADFHDFMSSYMDKQVEGSVGGNVFGHFVMTIDYVGQAAYFRCVNGCKPSTPPQAP